MPLWTALYTYAYWPALAALCWASWRWGERRDQRLTAAFMMMSVLAVIVLRSPAWHHFEFARASVDGLFCAYLIVLAVRSPQWWLIGLASLQLLCVFGHVAKLLDPSISRLTYALLSGSVAYPQLFLILMGIISDIRNRRSRTNLRA